MFGDILAMRGMETLSVPVWFEVAQYAGYMATLLDPLLLKQTKIDEWREHCRKNGRPCIVLDEGDGYVVKVYMREDISYRTMSAVRTVWGNIEGAHFFPENAQCFAITKIRSMGAAMDAASSLVKILS